MKKRNFITQKTAPYIFCAPFILSFCIFLLYPMINMVYMSFRKMQGIGSYRFVGLANYFRVFKNEAFRVAVANTLKFSPIIVSYTVA